MLSAYDIAMLPHMLNDLEGALRQMERHRLTITWIRASCERDGLPAWLTDLVIERARWQMLDPLYPLLREETTQP